MANRFVTEDLIKIDLGDGDWIKVKSEITYWELTKMNEIQVDSEKMQELFIAFIKEWNLKDAEGKEVPCTKDNILKLNFETLTPVINKITEIMQTVKVEAEKVKNDKKKVND